MGLSVPRGAAAQGSPRAGPRLGAVVWSPRQQYSGGRIHSHWKTLSQTVGLLLKDICDPLRNSLAAGVPARVCRQQPESGALSRRTTTVFFVTQTMCRAPPPGSATAAWARWRGHSRNLVDPASSHMLVSKIKPCMSKYKPLHGETANGSLKQLSSP